MKKQLQIIILILIIFICIIFQLYNNIKITKINENFSTYETHRPFIWLYWETSTTTKPAYIDICLETVMHTCHADFDIYILNDRTIFDYLPSVRKDLNHLPINVKVNYYKYCLLEKYGGIWLDSDVIVMKNLLPLIHLLQNYNYIGMGGGYYYPTTWGMAARPNDILMTRCRVSCDRIFDNKIRIEIGQKLLSTEIQQLLDKKGTNSWSYHHYGSNKDKIVDNTILSFKPSANLKTDSLVFQCINLTASKERWQYIHQQALKANIAVERVNAINGSFLSKKQVRHYRTPRITNSSVGCYLSHLNIWKSALLKRTEIVAIIEDDVILTPNIRHNLDLLMQTELPSDWDILYLGCTRPCGKRISNGLLSVTNTNTKNKCNKRNAGMYAYIVRRRALPMIIRGCDTPPFFRMIDHQLCTLHANPLHVYVCDPPLVSHNFSIPSDRIVKKIYSQKYQQFAKTTTVVAADPSHDLCIPFHNIVAPKAMSYVKTLNRDQLLNDQIYLSKLYKTALME